MLNSYENLSNSIFYTDDFYEKILGGGFILVRQYLHPLWHL